jgi:hypothetical protein
VSSLEVRPSPWRQAVDLANMTLVVALRNDAPRVYEIALRSFTPEDVAEAFAAARGMAIPTELRRYLKEDPRDLIAEFRALAPPRPPISIQRWSARRIGLTVSVVGRHARDRDLVARGLLPRTRLSYAGARITSGRALPPSSRYTPTSRPSGS